MNSKNKIIVNNVNETTKFAIDFAKNIKTNDIILLEGDLGVGKTVIAKAIGKFFKIKEEIVSPTFNIIKQYEICNNEINKLYHFDLYRLKNTSDLDNIGFFDYIYEDNTVSLIEWPELATSFLPKHYIKIKINKINNDEFKREIIYEIK